MLRRLALLTLLAVAACTTHSASGPAQLTVFAAASLRGPLPAIAAGFRRTHPRTNVTFSFAGSQALVAQLQAGAPADVVATADATSIQAVAGELAGGPTEFARNQLAIVTAPGNPRHLHQLSDLAGKGIRAVLAGPTVPAGRAARAALSLAGVRLRPVTLTADVTAVVATVRLGEADAGIAYATDVKAAGGAVVGVPVPGISNAYFAGAVRRSRQLALGRSFVEYLRSPTAQQLLAAAGFLPPA